MNKRIAENKQRRNADLCASLIRVIMIIKISHCVLLPACSHFILSFVVAKQLHTPEILPFLFISHANTHILGNYYKTRIRRLRSAQLKNLKQLHQFCHYIHTGHTQTHAHTCTCIAMSSSSCLRDEGADCTRLGSASFKMHSMGANKQQKNVIPTFPCTSQCTDAHAYTHTQHKTSTQTAAATRRGAALAARVCMRFCLIRKV